MSEIKTDKKPDNAQTPVLPEEMRRLISGVIQFLNVKDEKYIEKSNAKGEN